MAYIDGGLYVLLASDNALSAIIGTDAYRQRAPENEDAPFVVYRKLDTDAETMLTMGGDSEPKASEYEFVGYHTTDLKIKQLAIALWNALENYEGTVGSVVFQWIKMHSWTEEMELIEGGTKEIHLVRMMGTVWTEGADG
jgi:hypothetical protein